MELCLAAKTGVRFGTNSRADAGMPGVGDECGFSPSLGEVFCLLKPKGKVIPMAHARGRSVENGPDGPSVYGV